MRLFEQIRLGTGWVPRQSENCQAAAPVLHCCCHRLRWHHGAPRPDPNRRHCVRGVLLAVRHQDDCRGGPRHAPGKIPSTRPLAESFAKPDTRLRLVRAGIFYSIVLVTAAAIWQFLGADEIAQWQITKDDRVVWSSALQHIPYGAIIASTAFYIPCMMAMWFTPLLIYLKEYDDRKGAFLFVHRLPHQSRGRDHSALPCLLHLP